jgi:predicted transcriptional regulator
MKSIEVNTKRFNTLLKDKGMTFGEFAKAAPTLSVVALCKLQESYPLEANRKQILQIQRALRKLKFTSKEIADVVSERTQLSLFDD